MNVCTKLSLVEFKHSISNNIVKFKENESWYAYMNEMKTVVVQISRWLAVMFNFR